MQDLLSQKTKFDLEFNTIIWNWNSMSKKGLFEIAIIQPYKFWILTSFGVNIWLIPSVVIS